MKNHIKNTIWATCFAIATTVATVSITGCSGDRYHRSTGAYLDDKTINAKVKTDLLADPVVKGTQVNVDTYQGTVQLSGFVDTAEQRQRAEQIARGVKGVATVQNNLNVRPEPAGSPK